MADFKDRLADYIPVNERLMAFYTKHPEGSIQSDMITLTDNLVVFRASAYRSPDDSKPGVGHSSMTIPGSTSFTRGSEIENAETSAWGRALAALGFEVKRGVASRDEIENKQDDTAGGNRGPIDIDAPPVEDYSRNPFVFDGKPKLATLAQRGALTKLARKIKTAEQPDLGLDFLKERMKSMDFTRETLTPAGVEHLTKELIDLAADTKNVERVEQEDIEF